MVQSSGKIIGWPEVATAALLALLILAPAASAVRPLPKLHHPNYRIYHTL